MGNIKDREKARREVVGMFSTAKNKDKNEEVKEVAVEEVQEVEAKVKEVKTEVTIFTVTPEPKKKGRPVVNRETKKRFSLTLLPSIYADASKVAYEQGKSLSEVVGEFLSEYVRLNQDKLK